MKDKRVGKTVRIVFHRGYEGQISQIKRKNCPSLRS
jgi:hypothetical protein